MVGNRVMGSNHCLRCPVLLWTLVHLYSKVIGPNMPCWDLSLYCKDRPRSMLETARSQLNDWLPTVPIPTSGILLNLFLPESETCLRNLLIPLTVLSLNQKLLRPHSPKLSQLNHDIHKERLDLPTVTNELQTELHSYTLSLYAYAKFVLIHCREPY